MTLHSLISVHRETNVKLNRKLSSTWVAFIVLEDAIQATGEEKTSVVIVSPGIVQY